MVRISTEDVRGDRTRGHHCSDNAQFIIPCIYADLDPAIIFEWLEECLALRLLKPATRRRDPKRLCSLNSRRKTPDDNDAANHLPNSPPRRHRLFPFPAVPSGHFVTEASGRRVHRPPFRYAPTLARTSVPTPDVDVSLEQQMRAHREPGFPTRRAPSGSSLFP